MAGTSNSHRVLRALGVACACLALLLGVGAGGADADEAKRRHQREIQVKIQELNKNMEQLAESMKRTGFDYEARLLEAGLKHVEAADIPGRVQKILDALEGARPQTETARREADEVVGALELLLAILEDRDRQFTEQQLKKRVEAAREAAKQAEELSREEQRIKEELDKLAKGAQSEAGKRAEELKQDVAKLQREQSQLQKEIQRDAAEELAKHMATLDNLRRQQEAALQRTETARNQSQAAGRAKQSAAIAKKARDLAAREREAQKGSRLEAAQADAARLAKALAIAESIAPNMRIMFFFSEDQIVG